VPTSEVGLILGSVVAATLGLVLVGESLGLSTRGLKRWAGSTCVVTAALIAGQEVLVGAMGLSTRGPELRVGSQKPDRFAVNAGRLEARVGPDGQGGELGVRSRDPEGDDAGAALFVKGPDAYELRLDYRLLRRPRFISTSPQLLDVVTPRGVDVELNPGVIATEGSRPGRAITRVGGRILAEGRRTLTVDPQHGVLVFPDADGLPRRAAPGTLRLLDGRLVVGSVKGDGR